MTATIDCLAEPAAPETHRPQPLLEEAGARYLIFVLGGEEYALEVGKAREVLDLRPVTPVPNTAPFVKGVMNCRGNVVPVLDLRVAFGLPADEDDDTCIILADSDHIELGLVVDRVAGVIDVGDQHVEETPSFEGETGTSMIRGIRRDHGTATIVLDIGMVMAPSEARALAEGAGCV
jgi:purine-binding chemotaxis protein CheW